MPCLNCECLKCIKYKNNKDKPKKIIFKDGLKLCTKCDKYIIISLFDSNGKGKIRGECKECRKITNKKVYLKRKEKIKNNTTINNL